MSSALVEDPRFVKADLGPGRSIVVYRTRPGLPAPSVDACMHCGAHKLMPRELRSPGGPEVGAKPRCWGCGREQ